MRSPEEKGSKKKELTDYRQTMLSIEEQMI